MAAGFQDAMLKRSTPCRTVLQQISAGGVKAQDARPSCSAFSIGWGDAGQPAQTCC